MVIDYRLYCDEAFTDGGYPMYRDFYGGVLVEERSAQRIEDALASKIEELGLTSEVKSRVRGRGSS